MTGRLAISTALVLAVIGSATAAELGVRSDGEGDFRTIQAAVDAAAPGDVVLLADGVYSGPGNTNIDLRGKAIVVRSESGDPTRCIVDCHISPHELVRRGFNFISRESAATVLQGITIRYGRARGTKVPVDHGGAIFISKAGPTIADCVFIGNAAVYGACISGRDAYPTIRGCRFESNTAYMGGAVFFYRGDPHIEDCVFTLNTANWGGGLAQIDATSRIEACEFLSNQADEGGGMYVQKSDTCSLTDCVLYGNTAVRGGGIYSSKAEVRIVNCELVRNAAGTGGGIQCADGSALGVERSVIAFSLQGESVGCDSVSRARVSCSLIFGNGSGDWVGVLSGQGARDNNLHVPPLFLDADRGDLQPRPESPLLSHQECRPIGVRRP